VGKPLSVAAMVDVPVTVDHFRYFAGYAPHAIWTYWLCWKLM
jgi:hypothetical protein